MFDVRDFMAGESLEPFPFTEMDGTEWDLPNMGLMTADDAARLLAGDYDALDQYAGAGAAAALNRLPARALQALGRAWAEHSGIDLGEDVAQPGKLAGPSRSSRPTARPSRRTSGSGASKTRKR